MDKQKSIVRGALYQGCAADFSESEAGDFIKKAIEQAGIICFGSIVISLPGRLRFVEADVILDGHPEHFEILTLIR